MVWRHLRSTWSLIFHNCLDTCGTNLFPYDLNVNKALLSNWRHIKPLSIRFRICWLLRRAEWGMKLQSKDSDSEVIDSVHCGSTLELAGTTKVGHGTRRYKATSEYINLKNFINYWLQRSNNRRFTKEESKQQFLELNHEVVTNSVFGTCILLSCYLTEMSWTVNLELNRGPSSCT